MELNKRIKEFYEDRTKQFLTRRMITCIRLDGKGFSKLTSKLNKPFDDGFSDDMDATAKFLCENIQGAKFAYTQSDEITIVLTDFDNLETSAWFDYNVQKMTSISASLATAKFNELRTSRNAYSELTRSHGLSYDEYKPTLAYFDSRVFQVPTIDEMVNVLIWRQQDCTRNSISMACDANFSHSATNGKSGSEKQEMLFNEKSINWNDYKTKYKRGSVIKKVQIDTKGVIRNRWVVDNDTPIFTQNKEYLTKMIGN